MPKKKILTDLRTDPESKVAYSDRCLISNLHDLAHPKIIQIEDNDLISLKPYLILHENFFGDDARLESIQKYVELTTVKRFASEDNLKDINNHPLFNVC